MKKIIETVRLNEIIEIVRKWIRKNNGKDDDMFNHPFAIF